MPNNAAEAIGGGGGGTMMAVVLGVLLICSLIAGLAYYFFFSKSSPSPSPTPSPAPLPIGHALSKEKWNCTYTADREMNCTGKINSEEKFNMKTTDTSLVRVICNETPTLWECKTTPGQVNYVQV